MQSELNVKICSKCSVEKSAREYGKASRSKDGLHWWCKMCVRQYRKDNISRYSMLHVKYPETYRRSRKVWRENNKEKIKIDSKNQREGYKPRRRKRDRDRYASDIQFKMRKILRERLRKATKRVGKRISVTAQLGCSVAHFCGYIESLFTEGMSWQNWSLRGWHLDHKKPLSSFDLSDAAQVSAACHFSNIQPLWADANLKKGGGN